ncbi:Cannabidiolic acid synthase [Hibiscus syriacus]|uniref:Cannabidiolic acid synthase n=1 Tax=Hibiscus syriacus TaxID=106335 RepID=A0A6A2ZUI8_HIBSY|nr:cannabidiolic acid synthase-like [Hibiscus syriacus]KAE8694812.1 Cannabidiolic acid synthase [Hibiscus syriacus]
MKSFHFIFAVIFSLSSAIVLADANEKFVHCFSSLHPQDSSSIVIHTPNNSSYSSVLDSTIRNFRFATPTTPKPLVIVTPSTVSHIQSTIHCSRKHGLQIRTRSGGHDFEGSSFVSRVPFVLVDMVNLRSIDIDVENKVAWIQSGAILGELYYKLVEEADTLTFPAGLCPTVGIGGYMSGGGYGLLFRKYGLATDNVIDAQLVDAKGRLLDRKSMGEDLFWAIRGGGGGSFGIIVSWKIQLVPLPKIVTLYTVNRILEQNATQVVHQWQSIAHKLPIEFYSGITFAPIHIDQGSTKKKTVVASFHASFLGTIDELLPIMQERFPELGLAREDCTEMSWLQSILYMGLLPNDTLNILLDRTHQNPLLSPSFKSKSDYVIEPIPETAFEGVWESLMEEEAHSATISLIAYGGIMDQIPSTAIPYPHRGGILYKIVYSVGWPVEDNGRSEWYVNWTRRLYDYMAPFVSKSPRRAYINYRDVDIGMNDENGQTSYEEAKVWGVKYFMDNFEKLARVKTMIDPQNFFNHEQSIPVLPSSSKMEL